MRAVKRGLSTKRLGTLPRLSAPLYRPSTLTRSYRTECAQTVCGLGALAPSVGLYIMYSRSLGVTRWVLRGHGGRCGWRFHRGQFLAADGGKVDAELALDDKAVHQHA